MVPTAADLAQELDAFRESHKFLLSKNPPEQAGKQPTSENLVALCDRILSDFQLYLGEFQNQPHFVVLNATKGKMQTCFTAVKAGPGAHVPRELFVQSQAKQQLSEDAQHFYFRLAKFTDTSWLVAPLITLWLRQQGVVQVQCTGIERHISAFHPTLQLYDSIRKDSDYRMCHMSAFVDAETGTRTSLGLTFGERRRVVDLLHTYAKAGVQTNIKDQSDSFQILQEVDPVLQLFLWRRKLKEELREGFSTQVEKFLSGCEDNTEDNTTDGADCADCADGGGGGAAEDA